MIVRGTTPTIRFQFKTIDPREMEAAYLTISQDGVLIEKGLGEAEAYGDCLEWRLSQAETLSLVADRATKVQCRYRLPDGTAGARVSTMQAETDSETGSLVFTGLPAAPRAFAIMPATAVAAGYVSAASFDGSSVTGVQDNAPASLTQQYSEGSLTVGGASFAPSTVYRLTYAY